MKRFQNFAEALWRTHNLKKTFLEDTDARQLINSGEFDFVKEVEDHDRPYEGQTQNQNRFGFQFDTLASFSNEVGVSLRTSV